VQTLEDGVLPAVVEMEFNGAPLDMDMFEQWAKVIPHLREHYLWKAWRKIGFPVNPDKAEDLKRLFSKYKLFHDKRTDGGAQSFDAEVMGWAAKQVPEIALIERASKLGDLDSKFIQPYRKMAHNGHIYGTFHQLKTGEGGTVSGRFSMVRPNLQQVLSEDKAKDLYGTFTDQETGEGHFFNIRDLFCESSGSWFCADQAQVEFRVMAHYSKSQKILNTYALPHAEREVDGKMFAYQGPHADFHIVVMDMIRRQEPAYTRKQSKNYSFATGYGAGAAKRASMVNVSIEREAEINAAYRKEFPELGQLLKRCASVAETRGYVKTILGRRSRFPGGQRAHKALNAIAQGTAADLNKRALVELHARRKELGYLPRLTVHDEVSGRLDDAAAAPAVMAVLNTQFIPLLVPILWDGGVADGRQSWANAK
jgi:DNA polymerase-1